MIRSKKFDALVDIVQNWKDCTKCKGIGCNATLHVFWDTIPADATGVDILFIGEAPGQLEDLKGLPFVGPAGQVLRAAIKDAIFACPNSKMGFWCPNTCPLCEGRVVIRIGLVNLLLCRPYANPKAPHGTGNRTPTTKEVLNCMPRLVATIKAFNPEKIVFLGREAESYIPTLRDDYGISVFDYGFVHMVHPSFVLRRGGIGSEEYIKFVAAIKEQFRHFWSKRIDAYNNSDAGHGERVERSRAHARTLTLTPPSARRIKVKRIKV
jgi:uracil-DNA glycosylase